MRLRTINHDLSWFYCVLFSGRSLITSKPNPLILYLKRPTGVTSMHGSMFHSKPLYGWLTASQLWSSKRAQVLAGVTSTKNFNIFIYY